MSNRGWPELIALLPAPSHIYFNLAHNWQNHKGVGPA
jgi:hypothetical protein